MCSFPPNFQASEKYIEEHTSALKLQPTKEDNHIRKEWQEC